MSARARLGPPRRRQNFVRNRQHDDIFDYVVDNECSRNRRSNDYDRSENHDDVRTAHSFTTIARCCWSVESTRRRLSFVTLDTNASSRTFQTKYIRYIYICVCLYVYTCPSCRKRAEEEYAQNGDTREEGEHAIVGETRRGYLNWLRETHIPAARRESEVKEKKEERFALRRAPFGDNSVKVSQFFFPPLTSRRLLIKCVHLERQWDK